jgi:hypothetical protein
MVAAFAVNPALVLTGEPGILILIPLSLVFTTTGAFLAGRRPANPVGWLLPGWGMVMAFGAFTSSYVDKGLVRDPGSLPGPNWVAWAEAVVWHPLSPCSPSCCCCSPTAGCPRRAGGPSPGSPWPST